MQNIATKTGFTQQAHIVLQVRDLLEKSGYVKATSTVIAKTRLGGSISVGFKGNGNMPVETLMRLFFLGKPVALDKAQQALRPMDIDSWLEAGLIEVNDDQVIPLVKFSPYRDLLLIFDFEWAPEAVSHRQSVMGITGSSQFLANVTVRRPSRLTLDLGTGTGVQALLAARHSEKVITVDISERALAFAKFNAQLNGIKNIEFVEGDLFEPVDGLSFDLIISNPPFLISPENQCLYRDNPLDGDEFVQGIVRKMPRFLNQGGFGQVVCNWIQPGKENWANRLSGWYRGSGCDGWVIRQSETEPAKYAQSWLKGFKTKAMEQRQEAWLNYYKQNDIASVGFGLITLHRNSKSAHWSRIDKTLPEMSQNSGGYIDHIFQTQDFLNQTQEDQTLLNQRLRVCPYLRIDKQSAPEPGGSWTTVSSRLVLTRGFLHQIKVDIAIFDAILFCKPHMTLGNLLRKIAIRQRRSPDEFIATYLPACRRLIELGFLWPVSRAIDHRKDNNPKLESKDAEIANLTNMENRHLNIALDSSTQSKVS